MVFGEMGMIEYSEGTMNELKEFVESLTKSQRKNLKILVNSVDYICPLCENDFLAYGKQLVGDGVEMECYRCQLRLRAKDEETLKAKWRKLCYSR
jgi:hypothetical protein